MDRLTAMIAIAQLRLRLDIVTRYPHLLEDPGMEIRKPMELAGLKSRLARARKTEADIADTGKRFDKVLDDIDEAHGAAKAHVGDLEQYSGELKKTVEGMIAGSNGAPEEKTEETDEKVPSSAAIEPNALGGPRILK
jgi:hypothetical protein